MIEKELIDIQNLPFFNQLFKDYISGKLPTEFYQETPNLVGLKNKIDDRKNFSLKNREILHDTLIEQYQNIPTSSIVRSNIASLKSSNTFTITTGHQLNLCGGPMYFIYKIASVIKLCSQLKSLHPDLNFVPIFWLASEDHDIEEINHFYLFNKKIAWQTTQTGPAGRITCEGILEVLEEIKDIPDFIKKAYRKDNTLAQATTEWVNLLFQEYGLVIIDADNKNLKKVFIPTIKKEITQQLTYKNVGATNTKLGSLNYSTQAFVREINLFHLSPQKRFRIQESATKTHLVNEHQVLTLENLILDIDNNPHNYSPNVFLRPVYQETVLPNIAYIGGPAEINYWLQLKANFKDLNISFPVLIPRNFGLIIPKKLKEKYNNLSIKTTDLFTSKEALKEKYLINQQFTKTDLSTYILEVQTTFDKLKKEATKINKNLSTNVEIEYNKIAKGIKSLEQKFDKYQEEKFHIGINQLENIHQKLFPNGGLQERHDNFLNFYINDSNIIEDIINQIEPLDFNFHIFYQS